MKISAVVLTKNEEEKLQNCLKSLDFCDEIIVVDDNSNDKTLEIAKKHNAKVYKRLLNNNFADQRNFGMSKAKNDWIFFVDADEVVSEKLQKEVLGLVKCDVTSGYYIRRCDVFWNKEIKRGELNNAFNNGFLRLVKKGSGQWFGSVHEVFFIANGKIGKSKNYLLHYPHDDLSDFIKKINFYSTIRANELFENGKSTNFFDIMFVPFFKFIYTYFIQLGFLDGAEGFVYSFLMTFHSFLVRSKLYLLKNK